MNEMILTSILVISITINIMLSIISVRFAKIAFNIEDKLNAASVTLLDSEIKISKILKRPLFYDSPEIKSVLITIKEARDVLVNVAGELEMVEEDE